MKKWFNEFLSLKKYNETEKSWILYDVANSAYTLTIMTVFFPIFQTLAGKEVGLSDNSINTNFLIVTGVVSLIVAIMAPILGSMSDFKGNKMLFFKAALFLGVIFGFLLCIPSVPYMVLLIIYGVSTIFYTAAGIFYDSFLTDVTEEKNYNMVSSAGYAWGYIGSVVPFLLGLAVYALVLFKVELPFALSEKTAISIAFAISLIWWLLYSIPMMKGVKQNYYIEKDPHWIEQTFTRLGQTLRKIINQPKLGFFLLAYFFFIDAVYTIIKSAVQIGNSFDNVDDISLVVVVLIVQIIAFPCAITFGILAKKWGEIKMLTYGIVVYIIICILGYFLGHITNNANYDLFIFAALIGTAQGGLQAVSRSYFGFLIPKNESGEYYGFFNIFGRFASVLGPFLMAGVLALTQTIENNVRFATLSLIPLLLIGLFFLLLSAKYPINNKDYSID